MFDSNLLRPVPVTVLARPLGARRARPRDLHPRPRGNGPRSGVTERVPDPSGTSLA